MTGPGRPRQVDDETIDSCTIVTTQANELVGNVHPRQRMPVILGDDAARALWMDHDADIRVLQHLFQPYDDCAMRTWPADDPKRSPTLLDDLDAGS